MQIVTKNHPSAGHTGPTRNFTAESGEGTAVRITGNRLPYKAARLSLGGLTQRPWGQSAAREEKKGVLPPTRAKTVMVRSANTAPTHIGVNKSNWGIAGFGDAPKPTAAGNPLMAAAALVGLFLILR